MIPFTVKKMIPPIPNFFSIFFHLDFFTSSPTGSFRDLLFSILKVYQLSHKDKDVYNDSK